MNTVGCSWKDVVMRAFSEELRRDVVAIVRISREPREKIADDFSQCARQSRVFCSTTHFRILLRLGSSQARSFESASLPRDDISLH